MLADPVSVQLDITYGQPVGFAPDVAGPFTYSGATAPASAQVYRTGVGQYAFQWSVPANAQTGVYVANWTCVFGSDTLLGEENFPVAGGSYVPPFPAGDLGYWTGGFAYVPDGNPAALAPVSIPLGQVDGNGVAWLLQKVDGWDSPDVQGGGLLPKAGDHGAWSSPQFYAPRQLTITVTASAPTQALRDTARAMLHQAIPVGDYATFTYNEPVPKQAMVRRSGRITETYPTLTDVTFTIGAVAPDPRKYSTQANMAQVAAAASSLLGISVPFTLPVTLPAQQPGGSIAVLNAGTFETRPVITITGPVVSPALVNVTTGQAVSWTGLNLGPDDMLVADFNVAQARLNGAFRAADLFSAWWTLPPGTSTVELQGTAQAGASVAVAWSSAWI